MSMNINNGKMILDLPECFKVVGEEQSGEMYATTIKDRVAFYEEESQMIVSILWEKVPAVLNMVGNIGAIRDSALNNTAAQVSTYEDLGKKERIIGGQRAFGFRFAYTKDEKRQISENWLLKHKKFFYTIVCTANESVFDDAYARFEELVQNTRLK